MRRQSCLPDLLIAASAIMRAPAACLAACEQGRYGIVALHGALPEPDEMTASMELHPGHVALPAGIALTLAPWSYTEQICLAVPRSAGMEPARLCFFLRHPLTIDDPDCHAGVEAIMRQIGLALDCDSGDAPHADGGTPDYRAATEDLPVEGLPHGDASPDRPSDPAPDASLPSIEDLPGIGTFEIRHGSGFITLSAELVRLSGVPTGMQCPIDVFAQCMPVSDADLIHFAEGSSDRILLPETDYAIIDARDHTQSWVRRRAEIEFDEHGRPWRLIGTLEDITRDRVATNRLSAMVMLGDALRRVDTPDQAYDAAASALGDALGVDRAGWASFDGPDDKQFTVMPDWIGATIASAAGSYPRSGYKVALGILDKGLLLVIRDARENLWLPCRAVQGGGEDQLRAQLLMPLMGQGRVTHCLFVQSCTPRDWSDQELAFMRAVSDRAQAAAASLEARVHQQTLHQELAHRLKNTLALVQALANQSLRGVENRAAVKAFEKRLVALGSAHELLMKQSWQSGDLQALACGVLSRIAPIERFTLRGGAVAIGPNTATTLGLMLHELGTNAAKYGALSADSGTITLEWRIVEEEGREMLALHWSEAGGPPVTEPQSTGFGSRLLRSGFGHQGHAVIRYPVEGCDARFTIPLRQAQEN